MPIPSGWEGIKEELSTFKKAMNDEPNPNIPKIITCDLCYYGVPDKNDVRRCRRNPPVPMMTPHQNVVNGYNIIMSYTIESVFPEVNEFMWCGEGKLRKKEESI